MDMLTTDNNRYIKPFNNDRDTDYMEPENIIQTF